MHYKLMKQQIVNMNYHEINEESIIYLMKQYLKSFYSVNNLLFYTLI